MTIVEGSSERHKSRLASPETGDWLTSTYSEISLDRTESVVNWSRERRAHPGRELVKPYPLSLSENVIDVLQSYQCPNTH